MNKTKKKLLYITELFPYPPTSGGKIKSLNTIQTLSKKFNINLICFSQREISKNDIRHIKQYVETIKIFVLPNLDIAPKKNILRLSKNYLKLNPYLIYQFYSKEAKLYINKFIFKKNPNVIHIDHLNMAQYLPKIKKQIWIHEEHNIEHQLAWTKFREFKNWKKTKLFLLVEYLLIYLYEFKTYKKFDHIFTISDFDKIQLEKEFKLKRTSTQIISYKANNISYNKKYSNEILFVGDITWEPNKQAILWFVKKIFPLIIKKIPKCKFVVVGQIENEFANNLKLNKNIKVTGFKKDINSYLLSTNIFILPFKIGSGIRIKSLTALSYAIPIVSTKIGVQGLSLINLKDALITNDYKLFASYCVLLIKNKKFAEIIGTQGYKYLKNQHSINQNKKYLQKYINIIQ